MYLTAHANNISKWREPTTLARRMHVCKSLVSYPWDMDTFIAILCARRENVHANFSLRGLCDLDILL